MKNVSIHGCSRKIVEMYFGIQIYCREQSPRSISILLTSHVILRKTKTQLSSNIVECRDIVKVKSSQSVFYKSYV